MPAANFDLAESRLILKVETVPPPPTLVLAASFKPVTEVTEAVKLAISPFPAAFVNTTTAALAVAEPIVAVPAVNVPPTASLRFLEVLSATAALVAVRLAKAVAS